MLDFVFAKEVGTWGVGRGRGMGGGTGGGGGEGADLDECTLRHDGVRVVGGTLATCCHCCCPCCCCCCHCCRCHGAWLSFVCLTHTAAAVEARRCGWAPTQPEPPPYLLPPWLPPALRGKTPGGWLGQAPVDGMRLCGSSATGAVLVEAALRWLTQHLASHNLTPTLCCMVQPLG